MSNNESAKTEAILGAPRPEFSNLPIDDNELPKTEELVFEGLAPSYIQTLIIETIFGWTIVTIFISALAFLRDDIAGFIGQFQVIVPFVILVASSLIWQFYVSRSRGFILREKDIHYKSGVLWQKVVSLPYNRVQHVEMESNPVERRFKLTTLKLFTSGGGKADMKIPAVEFERASRLRAYVIERAAAKTTPKGEAR
jgi:uncharacterized protein